MSILARQIILRVGSSRLSAAQQTALRRAIVASAKARSARAGRKVVRVVRTMQRVRNSTVKVNRTVLRNRNRLAAYERTAQRTSNRLTSTRRSIENPGFIRRRLLGGNSPERVARLQRRATNLEAKYIRVAQRAERQSVALNQVVRSQANYTVRSDSYLSQLKRLQQKQANYEALARKYGG